MDTGNKNDKKRGDRLVPFLASYKWLYSKMQQSPGHLFRQLDILLESPNVIDSKLQMLYMCTPKRVEFLQFVTWSRARSWQQLAILRGNYIFNSATSHLERERFENGYLNLYTIY